MDPITIMLGISQIIPSIAKMFGGDNAASIAEKAVNIVKDVTGTKDASDISAITEILKANPNLLVEIETKVKELEVQKAQIEATRENNFLVDTQSARTMNTETVKTTGKRDWLLGVLALIPTLTIVAIVVILLSNGVQDEFSKNILNMVIGGLLARFGDVYSFFMGTSRSEVEHRMNFINHASQNSNTMNSNIPIDIEAAAKATANLNK